MKWVGLGISSLLLMLVACSSDPIEVHGVAPYFVDRSTSLHALERVPLPRLSGTDGPAAIKAPDGRIVYVTYDEKTELDPLRSDASQGVVDGTVLGRSSVRVAGPAGDELLVDGAFAPAVSAGGRIAVGLLDDPDHRHLRPHLASIAVVEPGSSTPIRWTPSGELFTPVAWVGESLIYAVPAGLGMPHLRIMTGPGRDRLLAERAALVAVSPDRERVLLSVATGGGDQRTFEVHSTATGQRLAQFTSGLRWAGLGSWSADGIVVVGAPQPGHLAALELDEQLRLRRTVAFPIAAELASPPSEVAVLPGLREFSVSTFVVGSRAPEVTWVILTCSLDSGHCSRQDLHHGVQNVGFIADLSA